MAFYEKHVLPRIIDIACGIKPVGILRETLVPLAVGNVLEVGIGTGLNLPYYDSARVQKIWGLDPALAMQKFASRRIAESGLKVELLGMSGEEIQMDTNSFDTVLLTFTLCSIPNGIKALREMRRVLKPSGQLIFCEHGRAPDEDVGRWQDRLTPLWRRIAGGCHLNRPIADQIIAAGFEITNLQTEYLPGPRPLAYTYRGTAS